MAEDQEQVVQEGGPGEDYYRENYPNYARQNPPNKLGFYMSLLRRWLPDKCRLFELGVGMGAFLKLASSEYECSGCDVNKYGVQTTQRLVPGVSLHVGSYERLPESRETTAVVAWDVLEHIPDLDAALTTIHDRLAEPGFLVAVVPVYDGPLGWLVKALDHDPTHVSKLGRRDWLRLMSEHGFVVEEWGCVIRRLFSGRWYMHITRPQFLLKHTGTALYFVARKG